MKKDEGKEPVAPYRNGHRNPNSPVLTAFDSNEEIERDISDEEHTAKPKKTDSDSNAKKKKKKKKPGKSDTDPNVN